MQNFRESREQDPQPKRKFQRGCSREQARRGPRPGRTKPATPEDGRWEQGGPGEGRPRQLAWGGRWPGWEDFCSRCLGAPHHPHLDTLAPGTDTGVLLPCTRRPLGPGQLPRTPQPWP